MHFEKIVEENSQLVIITAKKYKHFFPNINLNDLISEGNYGLFQAAKHYNRRKNVKFSTYAQFWIKKYMRSYIIENYTIVHVPHNFLTNTKKVFSLIDKNEHISPEEISRKLNLDIEKVKDLLVEQLKTKKELSLDKYLDESEQQETFYEVIPDTSERTPEELTHQKEIKSYVDSLLGKISHIEAEVIKWRFGFKDHRHHTIKDVAQKLNLSQQKVKELEEIALMKLREIADLPR